MDIRKKEAAWLRSQGLVLREIAVAIGVSERTMERWSTHPEFQSFLASVRNMNPDRTKITVVLPNLSTTIDSEDLENYEYKDDGSSRIAQLLARRQSSENQV